MNKHKRLLAVGLCGLAVWAGSVNASDRYDRYERHDRYQREATTAYDLDRRGDRIQRRLDRKGDRIEHRLRHQAEELRAHGHYAEARRLERKGAKINRHLDRKGERINRKLDRKAAKLQHHGAYKHGHFGGDRWVSRDHHSRVYDHARYRPRHRATDVHIAFDLGRWVFRH